MTLTEQEQDFARWMEELDLEEVNLLGPQRPPASDAFGQAAAPRPNLDGGARPLTQPARDTGWKAD